MPSASVQHQVLEGWAQLLSPAPRVVRSAAVRAHWRPSEAARAWIAGRGPIVLDASRECEPASDVRVVLAGGACGVAITHAQSYRIEIAAGHVRIEGASLAGLRYARATLRQLVKLADSMREGQTEEGVPCGVIDDEPLVAHRGVMLDVSRCRIPTMRELLCIIDQLADLKCNHLQLYVEHTFAYAGHEDVWRGWSAITPHELSQIDRFCAFRGIELAANQNCFGHMQHWLKNPAYAHLAETHGEWSFAGAWPRSGPWSLCPTDMQSLAFVRDLLTQQTACVQGDLCNINCDETYDIAYGRSKELVERVGREKVYLDFVKQVTEIVRELDKRAMVWGDIALSHTECLREWPSGAIALAWDYEPPAAEDDRFDAWARTLQSHGIEAWLCPGTSSWCSFFGRTSERKANLASALQAASKHSVSGVMMTDWGDFGHWQTWPIAWRGIAAGVDGAWNPRGERAEAEHAAASVQHFGQSVQSALQNPEGNIAAWIDELGDVDLHLRRTSLPLSRPGVAGVLRNQSACFADMRVPWGDVRGLPAIEPWDVVREKLRSLASMRPSALSQLMQDECEHTLACASFAASRAIARRRTPGSCEASVQKELGAAGEELVRQHARLWRVRSRSGGLSQSVDALMSPVLSELRELRQRPLFA